MDVDPTGDNSGAYPGLDLNPEPNTNFARLNALEEKVKELEIRLAIIERRGA